MNCHRWLWKVYSGGRGRSAVTIASSVICGWSFAQCRVSYTRTSFADFATEQFNEPVLYTTYFCPNSSPTQYPLTHRKSCVTCSVNKIGFECCNAVYARMRRQARISRGKEAGKSDIRQWHDMLRAAINILNNVLAEPCLRSTRELLEDNERFRDRSSHPAFANRTNFLMCDTVTNVLDLTHDGCLAYWSTHAPTTHLHRASASFWVIVAAYHLGYLVFVKHFQQDSSFMKNMEGSNFGSLSLCLKMAVRQSRSPILEYVVDEYLRDAHSDKEKVMHEACLAE